ncbi:MAG: hypothetical protein Q9209_002568 [Squamulea sp. 1 TL-2023]
MRSAMISAALVAGAAATHPNATEPSYTTKVVTAFTTFCPGPTQITLDGSVITVTSATTVTLPCPTGCPVTVPVTSVPVVYCSTCSSTPSAEVPTTFTSVPETHPAPIPETHPAPIPETHPTPGTTAGPVIPSSPVESPVVPVPTGSSGPVPPVVSPPTYGNATVPAGPVSPVIPPVGTAPAGDAPAGTAPGTAGPTSNPGQSPVTPFQGAAPKMAASGVSLAGLLGLAAFFL